MAELTSNDSVSIATLKKNLQLVMHNPSLMMRTTLQTLKDISTEEANIVDPSSPFVFLLESGCIAASAAVQEMVVNTRKQYPELALNEDDLYTHMSDIDYSGRFSTCTTAEFYFVIPVNDIIHKSYEYGTNNQYKDFYIPRGSYIEVDGFTFTLEHAIIVRYINSEQMMVIYDLDYESPLTVAKTNIIDTEFREDSAGTRWLYFKVPMLQLQQTIVNETIHRSYLFNKTFSFEDQYYYLRAFYRKDDQSAPVEFKITHSDMVFDIATPTLLVKKIGQTINVNMPLIYNTMGEVDGDLTLHFYTTKGRLGANLSTYSINDFILTAKDSFGLLVENSGDPYLDIKYNSFKAFLRANKFVFSVDRVDGGSNGVDFPTLRTNLVYRSLGDRKLPITNAQLSTNVMTRTGFELVPDIDVVTNRVFLAVKKLPASTFELIKTPANIGIAPTIFLSKNFEESSSNFVVNKTDRVTMLSQRYFKETNGKVEIVDNPYTDRYIGSNVDIQLRIDTFNKEKYYYNPFYYVLDASGKEFSVRSYSLDDPSILSYSTDKADRTITTICTSINRTVEKLSDNTGYMLYITVEGTSDYSSLIEDDISEQVDGDGIFEEGELVSTHMQISMFDEVRQQWVFFKPKYVPDSFDKDKKQLKFSCLLETNFDLDEKDRLCLTNACVTDGNSDEEAYINLNSKVRLIYLCKDATGYGFNDLHEPSFYPVVDNGLMPILLETIQLELGQPLKNMWVKSRTLVSTSPDAVESSFKRYTEDVPAVYTEDVFGVPKFTITNNQVVFNYIHRKGDIIPGEFIHRAGDLIVDPYKKNVVSNKGLSVDRVVDIFYVDAKYLEGSTSDIINYRKEIRQTIVSWINKDINDLHALLIEKTRLFFYPKTTLSKVRVLVNGDQEAVIDAEQSLFIDMYVGLRIANNPEVQKDIYNKTVRLIDAFIDKASISVSDITIELRKLYGNDVKGIRLYGLGGENDYQVIYTKEDYNRLCIKKKLLKSPNNLIDVVEDISMKFINVESNN